jgi:hypothetical protein
VRGDVIAPIPTNGYTIAIDAPSASRDAGAGGGAGGGVAAVERAVVAVAVDVAVVVVFAVAYAACAAAASAAARWSNARVGLATAAGSSAGDAAVSRSDEPKVLRKPAAETTQVRARSVTPRQTTPTALPEVTGRWGGWDGEHMVGPGMVSTQKEGSDDCQAGARMEQ